MNGRKPSQVLNLEIISPNPFLEELAQDPYVTQQFNIALEMMQSVTTGRLKPPPAAHHIPLPKIKSSRGAVAGHGDTAESTKKTTHTQKDKDRGRRGAGRAASPSPQPSPAPSSFVEPTTFRQLVEEIARKRDILFIPTKRSYESKTIFSFGNVSIVIDKNMLLVWKNKRWVPVSIDELVKLATE